MGLIASTGAMAAQKTDVFTTKSGKEVKFTCIKHGSVYIQYDGLEIQVDPVTDGAKPITDYTLFPKANIIAVDYDPGASEVNQLNRIKLMLSTAIRNQLAEPKTEG